MDLPARYAKYNDYIREDKLPASSRENRFARGLWGNPLTFEEFREQWQRICRDPALKQLWERRLEAGYEARMAKIRKMTAQMIASVSDQSDVGPAQAIPA